MQGLQGPTITQQGHTGLQARRGLRRRTANPDFLTSTAYTAQVTQRCALTCDHRCCPQKPDTVSRHSPLTCSILPLTPAAQSGAAGIHTAFCSSTPYMPGVLGNAHHQLLPPPLSPAHSHGWLDKPPAPQIKQDTVWRSTGCIAWTLCHHHTRTTNTRSSPPLKQAAAESAAHSQPMGVSQERVGLQRHHRKPQGLRPPAVTPQQLGGQADGKTAA